MRDCTQPAQEERYQISTLLQTGRQHSKIVRYGVPTNILENSTGLQQLHNRVDSLPKVGKWMERHYGK